ncbi:hypothetical protein V491_00439 [Pseudogymnoascus sp. VKM F-3775]|nr:hypothetical protein V491_00439 [Pseudogymnoascus sp. VKM F-3775]
MVIDVILALVARHWPSALVVIVIVHFIRNYFHHGLNQYPGPFLARITNWWRFWDVYNRRPEVTHIRLHEKHGDVVRLGPNYLSFADPKAVKDIYGLNKGFIKSQFYPVQQSVSNGHRLPSLFSTTDEKFHANLRRSINSAFSMSTLVQYEPLVDSTTAIFLSQTDKLYAAPGAVCDFARWLQFYAFDVIGNMTYSERHGFLERNEDIEGIIAYLGKLFSYVAPIGQIPFLDLLLLKNPLYLLAAQHGFIDATFPVARFARARLEERIASSSEPAKPSSGPPDLLSKFITAQQTHPNTVTQKEVLTLAVSMAFAGSETTAISLSSIFYYLLRNPPTLTRLLAELDDAEKRGGFADATPGVVSWAEAQQLPYLDAVVKEAFRVHPAAGLPLERVIPPAGATIAGHFVPGGTIVGCSAWVLHQNPTIFGADSSQFRPERWLPSGAADSERIKEMNAALFHFGSGSRTCIGKNISLLEIYKVVPSLLRAFEVVGTGEEWRLWNSWFVRQLGFEVRFRKREVGREK